MVLVLGECFIYDKIKLNDNDVIQNEELKEENFNQSEAKKIVYKYSAFFNNSFDQIIEISEEDKISMALKNVSDSNKQSSINCQDLSNIKEYVGSQCYIGNNLQEFVLPEYPLTVTYDDLNESYKYLFGKESSASKISTEYAYYDSKTNNYYIGDISSCFGGIYSHCAVAGLIKDFGVITSTIKDNMLTIDIGYFEIWEEDDSSGRISLTDEKYDSSIIYDNQAIEKIFNENKDKVDNIYRWIFKQEDGRFTMLSMKKL